MRPKAAAAALCRKFATKNPLFIAEKSGIIVRFEPLGTIYGYYHRDRRCKFIHINSQLDEQTARFTAAHELGHAVLHPNTNTPFLREHTLLSVDKLETEANRFAVSLLYDDYDLQPFLTRSVTDAAAFMGVPVQLAEYRMETVEPTLWCR